MHPAPSQCPVCNEKLEVRKLSCPACDTEVSGRFSSSASRYSALEPRHAEFLEVFLRHRGVLTSIGDELKISYPTVRSRLDALLSALDLSPAPERAVDGGDSRRKKTEIIEQLERGELSAEEAKQLLRETR